MLSKNRILYEEVPTMQICDGYFQSSAPRELLKPNRRRSQHPENGRKEGRVLCSPPPPSLLNFLGEKPPLRHTNGYSIAEILLVFGIIAGVLIGVWAMYTMLAEEVDVKAAVAEIQIIREAAVQFKTHNGNGKYNGMTLAILGSYLGDGVAPKLDYPPYGVILNNTFGDFLFLISNRYKGGVGEDLYLESQGLPSLNVCRQILEHFGEVEKDSEEMYRIPVEKSIWGYVGSHVAHGSGCTMDDYDGPRITLHLYID